MQSVMFTEEELDFLTDAVSEIGEFWRFDEDSESIRNHIWDKLFNAYVKEKEWREEQAKIKE